MGTNGFVRSGGRVWVGTVLLPVLLLAAVAGGGRWALAQDGTPDPETTGDAAIRLVHASPDAGPVDVYVNDELVVAGLDYPDVSDFLFRPAGVYDIAVTAAGDAVEDALIEADGVAVEAGRAYHIATVGTLAEDDDADLQTRVHEVNLDEVPDGQARVRVVHASPDAGTVDVAVNDEVPPPFVGVAYPDASEEIEVAAGSYDLELRATGTDDALLALSADLEAGNVYSLYAVGRVADDTLDVLTVASGPEAAQVTAGRPAHIHQGGCDDLGEIIENGTLNNPVAPQGEALGQAEAAEVESSLTSVPLTLEALLAGDHAINVHLSESEIDTYIACGEIGGVINENGVLTLGLREQDGSAFSGVAILSPGGDGASTDIELFVTEAFGAALATDQATPAVEDPTGIEGTPLAEDAVPDETAEADATVAVEETVGITVDVDDAEAAGGEETATATP